MTTIFEEKKQLLWDSMQMGKKIPFSPTDDLVIYWWDVINDVVFDGVLREPKQFVYRKFHNTIGWCIPYRYNNKKNRRVRIGIRTTLNNLYDFLCVLIHEMVHQWEWEILGTWSDKVSHGKDFYSWRDRIFELTGAPLTSKYHINDGKKLTW